MRNVMPGTGKGLLLFINVFLARFLSFISAEQLHISKKDMEGCAFQSSLQRNPLVLFNDQRSKWLVENKDVENKLANGFSELDRCNYENAWNIFDNITQNEDNNAWLGYLGKAVASARKDMIINKSLDTAMKNLEKAMELEPKNSLVLQTKAEIIFRSGDGHSAMDIAKEVINMQPDGHAHVLAGIIAFKNDMHWNAMQYLTTALKYEAGNQAIVHQCLGQSYMALGMLKQSISALQDCLEMQPENLDVLKTISSGFKELGDDKLALQHINAALQLNSQDAKSYMIRGHIYFSSGKVSEALEDYRTCLQVDADHYGCQYMKSLTLATLGRFYESVKASTKVMLSNLRTTFVPEYSQSFYLREFSRYLHSRLDTPLQEYRFDSDLDPNFREMWIKNLPWNAKNYTEQPGIQPHISDVEMVAFKDLSDDAKTLVCKAAAFEELLQYHSDGFMANWRTNKAMALAVIDVAQTAIKYWTSPVSIRGWKGKRFSWRDIFEVAVKWRKFTSMWYPVLWLDLLPKKVLEAGLSNRILFTVGNHNMPRFMPYFSKVFDLAKSMIRKVFSQKVSGKTQEQLQRTSSLKDFMSVLKKASPTMHTSFEVCLQIPSTRRKTSKLDGVLLTLSGQSEDDMSLVLESKAKPARTNQFHPELEYLWGKLTDDVMKQRNIKDSQMDIHNILTMVYYFYNLIPLSKGSSAVAYTVALGLFLAIGQEVTGPIPIDKQPDLEAMLGSTPEVFIKHVQRWLGLRRISVQQIQKLPSVTETFSTARSILEVLNTEIDDEFCKKRIPGYLKRTQ